MSTSLGPQDPLDAPTDPVSPWNIANYLTVARLLLVPVFLVALLGVIEESSSHSLDKASSKQSSP